MASGRRANRPSGMKLRPASRGSRAKRPPRGTAAASGDGVAAVVVLVVVVSVETGAAETGAWEAGEEVMFPGSFDGAHRPSSRCARPGNDHIIPEQLGLRPGHRPRYAASNRCGP